MTTEVQKINNLNDLLAAEMSDRDKLDYYNGMLNREPNKAWLLPHPTATHVKYLSIGRVEWLLTQLFKDWRVKILNQQVMANSVVVTVRLEVVHPITGKLTWHDGIGAAPIHTKKNKGATEFDFVLTDSVMKAAPAAKSYAIKDAAEHFGKVFGRDINRSDQIAYEDLMRKHYETQKDDSPITIEQENQIKEALNNADLSEEDREEFYETIAGGLNLGQWKLLMSHIQANEIDRIGRGDNYSQKDIHKKLDKQGA